MKEREKERKKREKWKKERRKERMIEKCRKEGNKETKRKRKEISIFLKRKLILLTAYFGGKRGVPNDKLGKLFQIEFSLLNPFLYKVSNLFLFYFEGLNKTLTKV